LYKIDGEGRRWRWRGGEVEPIREYTGVRVTWHLWQEAPTGTNEATCKLEPA
jgi:hypothetical protein